MRGSIKGSCWVITKISPSDNSVVKIIDTCMNYIHGSYIYAEGS